MKSLELFLVFRYLWGFCWMMGGTSTVVVPEGALFIADYKIQSETELLRTAFSNQKNIKAAEISLAMANEELSQSGRSFLPKIEAFASLETNTRDFESNPNNRMIGVKSKFPLGDPAYFSRKSAAHAHRDAAQYQKESIEESIRVSVIQTLKRFEGARDSFLLLKEARDHALKSLELFRPLYREGRQSILDVLRAEDSLMRADQAMLENLYQIHLMYARLALVTGTLSSVTVQEIQKQIEINP
jgi:outer membrane protein TolC